MFQMMQIFKKFFNFFKHFFGLLSIKLKRKFSCCLESASSSVFFSYFSISNHLSFFHQFCFLSFLTLFSILFVSCYLLFSFSLIDITSSYSPLYAFCTTHINSLLSHFHLSCFWGFFLFQVSKYFPSIFFFQYFFLLFLLLFSFVSSPSFYSMYRSFFRFLLFPSPALVFFLLYLIFLLPIHSFCLSFFFINVVVSFTGPVFVYFSFSPLLHSLPSSCSSLFSSSSLFSPCFFFFYFQHTITFANISSLTLSSFPFPQFLPLFSIILLYFNQFTLRKVKNPLRRNWQKLRCTGGEINKWDSR